jgi:peptide subunit release factor 1 (eRF1)
VAAITDEAIRELAAFRGQQAPVTTCYLDVDGRRLARPQELDQELDRLLRDARARAGGNGSVLADLKRVEALVRDGIDRSRTRGIVVFACQAHDLWEVVALPVPVHSRVVINSAPAVGQLEAILQDHPRIGVLLADKQRARMLVVDLGELTDRSELLEELPRDYDSRGHSDQGYDREQHHVSELTQQHLRHAASVAFQVFQDTPFEHLVLGAPDPVAAELESCLHPYLKQRLAGRIAVNASASPAEVRDAVLAVEGDIERRREAEVVRRLRDAVGTGQRAAAGLDAVLTALREQRVERLLVSAGFSETGWHCGSCGALAALGRTCPGCGAEMAHVDDVVEDAIEEALARGCKVEICVDNADLDVLGRIGALLRF